jgi:hypothetical protein
MSATETKTRKRKLIILEWGFWVLVAVAGIIFFINHTLAVFSIPLLLLGLISGAFALRLSLINNGAKHRWANLVCGCMAIPSVILCGYLFWVEAGLWNPKLHLALYVHTTDSPDDNLNFTNKFLVADVVKERFKFPKNLPFLRIDVAGTEPQFTLKFGVFNDSAPRFSPDEFDIEKPVIQVWIAKADTDETLRWVADDKWEKVSPRGEKFPGDVLSYQFPKSLAAGTGDTAPGITFNMQEKPSSLMIAVGDGGQNMTPSTYCFKLLAMPSTNGTSKLSFDTNSVVQWHWIYRPVAYRPIDCPIGVSPSRIHISDGKTTFGKEVDISNPSSNNVYAITFSVEAENGVPLAIPYNVELSEFPTNEVGRTGLEHIFETRMDSSSGMRLFTIPVLPANGHRSMWIRGTVLTNSFADISIWQSLNSFPEIKYMTNGMWMWPVLSSNAPFWIHIGAQPMDLEYGIMMWVGTNGFTNNSQIIPSRP